MLLNSVDPRPLDVIPKSLAPVVIVGAGPVGLAAAAQMVERGLDFMILESGPRVADSMRSFGHVRLFTPWAHLTCPTSVQLLRRGGTWTAADPDELPLVDDFVCAYLEPLAALPAIASNLRLNHRVVSISRRAHDRMTGRDRASADYVLVCETPRGPTRIAASAVIDASGTWKSPNPLGSGGVWADGELRHRDRIQYGMPDVLGQARTRHMDRRTAVVGSGHSAIGTVLDLVELGRAEPETLVAWLVRREDPTRLWGGGAADQLAARGALGTRVYRAVHSGAVTLLTGVAIEGLRETSGGLELVDGQGRALVEVDEIIAATGARPDLGMLRELRLDLDPVTEATRALGPMIDPNRHSCGSVAPHGAGELRHLDTGFYTVGIKSYGRAPTFLLRTGYEQVRSVVAEIAGDHDAAARVELVLPQTGICTTGLGAEPTPGSCC